MVTEKYKTPLLSAQGSGDSFSIEGAFIHKTLFQSVFLTQKYLLKWSVLNNPYEIFVIIKFMQPSY